MTDDVYCSSVPICCFLLRMIMFDKQSARCHGQRLHRQFRPRQNIHFQSTIQLLLSWLSKLFIATTITQINSHIRTLKESQRNQGLLCRDPQLQIVKCSVYRTKKTKDNTIQLKLRLLKHANFIKRQVLMWYKVHYLWIIQYLYLVLNNFNDLIFLISLQILFQTLTP